MADQAEEYREKLLETLAEADDDIMEKYLEGEEPSVEQTQGRHPSRHPGRQAQPGPLRHRVQEQGRPALLDAVVDYLPSPLDIDAIKGHKPGDESVEIERKPRRRAVLAGWRSRSPRTRTWAS
jgi:elongation factor G